MLNSRYRLESMLGRGGMGSVYRAEHLGLGAPVAVKLMDPEIARNPEARARFHREAQAAARIRSSHVVQVLDHGIDESSETAFIVMELLEGETLGERLISRGNLSLEDTARILGDVCRALSRAHEAGIVHRDLKPENIFLVRDERELAKVLDFGVAKAQAYSLSSGGGTRTGSLIGTPCYMSPEQIGGSKQLDARSDLWSVAVIACECVTGKRPFDAETVGALALEICVRPIPRASSLGPATPAFERWLERALERDVERRFQSARELSLALSAACNAEPIVISSLPAAAMAMVSASAVTANAAASAVPASAVRPDSAAERPLSHTFPLRRRQTSVVQRMAIVGAALALLAFVSFGLRARQSSAPVSSAPHEPAETAAALAAGVMSPPSIPAVDEQATAMAPPLAAPETPSAASKRLVANAAPEPAALPAAPAVPAGGAVRARRISKSSRKREPAKLRAVEPPAAAAKVTLESALEGERGKVRN
ncbi:MAG: serine/threonine-protein kinase [Polyangiaceae bacterium]